jgi:hypothetical protein
MLMVNAHKFWQHLLVLCRAAASPQTRSERKCSERSVGAAREAGVNLSAAALLVSDDWAENRLHLKAFCSKQTAKPDLLWITPGLDRPANKVRISRIRSVEP